MKKHIFSILAILAGILLTFAFVACDDSADEDTSSSPPILVIKGTLTGTNTYAGQDLEIDFRFNTLTADSANNYLKWKIGSSPIIEDYFDVVTSASKNYTTDGFSQNNVSSLSGDPAACFTAQGLTVLPGRSNLNSPVRGLVLFPVDIETAIARDAFQAFKNSDNSITIRYVHSNAANVIVTNPDGTFDIDTDCKNLPSVSTTVGGKQIPNVAFRKDIANSTAALENLNWDAVMTAIGLQSAATAPNYNGTLTVTLN